MAPLPAGPPHDEAETIIFVDVDGVLNVGVRDSDGVAPLLFNESNRAFAVQMKDVKLKAPKDEECKEKLLSVISRALPPKSQTGRAGDRTYTDLVCGKGSSIADPLAALFADIVRTAGPNASVVLSSNWRKPAHAGRVKKLEEQVTEHLGSPFKFSGATPFVEERCAADRLRCIADHLRKTYGSRAESRTPLRVLLLEDFFVTPMDGWVCEGHVMDSVAAAETYLRNQLPPAMDSCVKLVHTYDEWRTGTGLRVQVGAGLCDHFTRQALAYLKEPVRPKAQAHVPAARRLSAPLLGAGGQVDARGKPRSPSPTAAAGQRIAATAPSRHSHSAMSAPVAPVSVGADGNPERAAPPQSQTPPPMTDKQRNPVLVNSGASTLDESRWTRRLRNAVPWLST